MDITKLRRKMIFFFLICGLGMSNGISSGDFVSYGDPNDNTLKSNSGFSPLTFQQSLQFYGNTYSAFYITPDLQLVAQNSINIQESFQISTIPQITALKSNMDSSGAGGTIYYRIENSGSVLTEVSKIVQQSAFNSVFLAEMVIVVTYDDVRTADTSIGRNTFQLVVAVQGTTSYAIFNYEKIEGVQTYGNHGFVSHNGKVYQKHPTTPKELPNETNVCKVGQYIYKIDGDAIEELENCVTKPCLHGTCCVDDVAKCKCNDGWEGDQCNIQDKCFFKGCQNGQCSINAVTGEAECSCDTGFTGALCDTRLCDIFPCENGQCSVASGQAMCDCNFGWSGTACETNICDQRNCQNQGVCALNGQTEALCSCPTGFTGVECETAICQFINCNNGQCDPATGTCMCNAGWIGTSCNIAKCDTSNCIRGQCEGEGDDAECICTEGWTGDRCDIDKDECAAFPSPCQNGLCINEYGGYKCRCNIGFVGESCDKLDLDKMAILLSLTTLGLLI